MPQFDVHERIEAWNNLAAMIKFLSLEEYLKTATIKDFVDSLNKLAPHDNEEELIDNEIVHKNYKNTPGFITEKEMLISAIVEDLIKVITGTLGKKAIEEAEILPEEFKSILRKHIKGTIDD